MRRTTVRESGELHSQSPFYGLRNLTSQCIMAERERVGAAYDVTVAIFLSSSSWVTWEVVQGLSLKYSSYLNEG